MPTASLKINLTLSSTGDNIVDYLWFHNLIARDIQSCDFILALRDSVTLLPWVGATVHFYKSTVSLGELFYYVASCLAAVT